MATTDAHDALASHTDDYAVHEQLHDVPPHEVYEVTFEGVRGVCKLDASPEGSAGLEGHILRYVGQETSIPVPQVLVTGPDHFVAAWLDGLPEGPPAPEDPAYARRMGAGMARLHEETPFRATGLLNVDDGNLTVQADDRWSDTLVAFLARRREYLAGLDECDLDYADPPSFTDLADEAIAFVEANRDLFDYGVEPVLCHGNFLPDHVGFDGDDLAAVIDFEHALVGAGEYDLWRSALPMFGPDSSVEDPARRAFREGYESVRALPDGFDDRRRAYWAINGVSYLRSLHLQDQHGPEETRRRAVGIVENVRGTIAELRAKLE